MRYFMLVFIALALAVTGCSGSDDPAVDADVDVDAAADDDSAEADVAIEAEADTGAIDSERCQEIAQALQDVPTAVTDAATGQIDTAAIQAQADALQEVADQVPAEISDDFQVVADAFGEIATTLSGTDLQPGEAPSAEDQAALTELGTTLSDTEFATASANISTYFAGGCQ